MTKKYWTRETIHEHFGYDSYVDYFLSRKGIKSFLDLVEIYGTLDKLKEFLKMHLEGECDQKNFTGAPIEFILTCDSVFNYTEVRCGICGKREDFSNYELW